MNTELAEMLQAGMARVPAQVPPDLARTAYSRYRRRRATAWAAAAGGTIAVAGAVATASVVSGTGGPGAPGARTAAYVVDRVTSALDSAGANSIQFNQLRFSGSDVGQLTILGAGKVIAGGSTASGGQRVLEWVYAGQDRTEVVTADGTTVSDERDNYDATTITFLHVDYLKQTWYRVSTNLTVNPPSSAASSDSQSCGHMPLFAVTPEEFAAQLKMGVSCGELTVGDTSEVDGVQALQLTFAKGDHRATYWVDADTYLPVRVAYASGSNSAQDDLQWLQPTEENLAKLTVSIPDGFTRVAPPSYLTGQTPSAAPGH